MPEQQVPNRLTPVSAFDVYLAIRAAWSGIAQDVACSRAACLVLLAHWDLETARGKDMHCFNLGNAQHVPGDGRDYCQFVATERRADGTMWQGVESFLAFPSLEEGVAYYLTSLRGRWRTAWPFALAGDAAGFCRALQRARYYTADEATYTAGVVARMAELDKVIAPDTLPDLPPIIHPDVVADEVTPDSEIPPATA